MALNFSLLTCPIKIYTAGNEERCGCTVAASEYYVVGSARGVKVYCHGEPSNFMVGAFEELWTPLEIADAASAGLEVADREVLIDLIEFLQKLREAWADSNARDLVRSGLAEYSSRLEQFARSYDERNPGQVSQAAWDIYCREWAGANQSQPPAAAAS
jgi:hypothetical protein